MDNLSFEIEIPPDDDGFVLFQCPECGEFFKLRVNEIESDDVAEICCPACGIASDNYFTDDVVELAKVMCKNRVMRALHNEKKDLERKTRGKMYRNQLVRMTGLEPACFRGTSA